MFEAYRRHYAARLREVAAVVGPEAARLAALGHLALQVNRAAGALLLICGIWLERRGPAFLWAPVAVSACALVGVIVPTAITVRRMNRAASQYVSEVLGYSVTLVPNQFVLRRSSWQSAIERAKRAHDRQVAGKQQRWHL